ncbi:hypothetical protein [Lewinella cohaerens]|nr:hypothetical protein [Lewinella cohaerens]
MKSYYSFPFFQLAKDKALVLWAPKSITILEKQFKASLEYEMVLFLI